VLAASTRWTKEVDAKIGEEEEVGEKDCVGREETVAREHGCVGEGRLSC
jgi:hypothetical protein